MHELQTRMSYIFSDIFNRLDQIRVIMGELKIMYISIGIGTQTIVIFDVVVPPSLSAQSACASLETSHRTFVPFPSVCNASLIINAAFFTSSCFVPLTST